MARHTRPEFTLSSRDNQWLDALVYRIETHVRSALRASRHTDTITALGLFTPQDRELDEPAFFPDAVAGLSSEERLKFVQIEDRVDRWYQLWNAGVWDLDFWPSDREGLPGTEERHLWRVIDEHPEQKYLQGVSPEEWVLQIVCRRLAYDPPPQADRRVFTCILSEGSRDDWLEEVLAYATPPAVAAELERQGVFMPPLGY